MRLIVDGHEIPVQANVVVINENITGPLDGQTTDQLHTVYTPDNVIKKHVWQLNTPTASNRTQTSHAADTTAQVVASTCTIAG
jgi:hypothetical protein